MKVSEVNILSLNHGGSSNFLLLSEMCLIELQEMNCKANRLHHSLYFGIDDERLERGLMRLTVHF